MFSRHESHDEQANPSLRDGMAIWTADGERIGTLKSGTTRNGYVVVHQGRFFGHDYYVPQTLIAGIDANGVHLSVRKQDLDQYIRSEPPDSPPPAQGADAVVGAARPVAPTSTTTPGETVQPHRTAPLYEPGHPPSDHLATVTTEPQPVAPISESVAAAAATAGAMASQVGDQAGQAAGQAGDQAGQIAGQAGDQAGQIAGQVRERAAQEAATQMGNASVGLEGLAATLAQISAQLRGSNLNELAHYTDGAATQLDSIAARLHGMTPDELGAELQRVLREHPEVVVAGVLGLGLVIGRLVSAARQNNHEQP